MDFFDVLLQNTHLFLRTHEKAVGIFAVAAMIPVYVDYVRQMRRGTARPHAFSWLVWAVMPAIAAMAQFSSGAGTAAWITLGLALTTFVIFLLSLRYGIREFTTGDKIALAGAFLGIGIWAFSETPLWTVLIIIAVEIFGFYPTWRKTWKYPRSEPLVMYTVSGFSYLLSCGVLETLTFITVAYPLAVLCLNMSMVLMSLYRRGRAGIE